MRPTCADAFSCYASSKIGSGCQSIYNICILNYCKLTFEFFKNYIFEKRRQFLNRIRGRNIRGFEQQAEWIEHLNMLVSIKILARILMLHIGCTFGECRLPRLQKMRRYRVKVLCVIISIDRAKKI